jgi:HPt (histidine-containing phosphotransfer) domain-containing protein
MYNKTQEELWLESQLQLLREKYLARLPQKMQELEQTWKQLKPDTFDFAENLKHFHFLVHTINGSSASYGFSELSYRAHTLEVYLKPLMQARFVNQEQYQQLNKLFEELKRISTELTALA